VSTPVDWAAVERRARAREPLFVLGLAAVVGGLAAVSDRFVLAGAGKWLLAAAYVAGFGLLLAVQRLHPRMRARAAEGHRVQHALREHLDPGPALRERADRQATYLAGLVWMRWWLIPVVALGPLLGGDWNEPAVAVPGAVALVGGGTAWMLAYRRMWHDARRWVADPPGPPREMPELPAWQRWLTGWSFAIAMLVVLTVALAVGITLAVLD
jgi:hypothetical protein